ncbi:MAG: ATP-dependent helicase UvrD/PcrA [Acidimicrobiaceae bacterium]|jgi:DNA helicase-2/ATP-dependent DNA helicase PcrA
MFPALTDQQRAAVDHPGGHLLIVAGAGTGKTTTLASRLAALVERGTAPERILLLTFSRRAASELLRRAEALAGHDVARRVWGGTFHAVGNRVLRRHGRLLGLDPDFTVLDQADAADLLALVRSELHAHDGEQTSDRRRAKKDTMAAILSRVINTATPLSKVLHETFPWCAEEHVELKATFEAYTARKRSTLVLDYDDLLLCWSALVRSAAAAPLLDQFDHVLIDEYQDTNALQAEIVAAMAGGGATITAVGDDAQAIYGFRNATPRNILEFPDRFGAQIVVLDRNHRSTPAILATTNAVMAEAAHRHEKVLWSTRGDGPQPAVVLCSDEGAQSAAVCARILEQHERGVALRSQAVLFRAAHHSDLLELELGARRIPYVKFGGLRFLEAAHVKDLVCALRLVINPSDELAWFRVLQLIDGIGPATARKLAPQGGAIDWPGTDELLVALEEARRLAHHEGPSAAIERLRAWLEPIIERHHANAAARIADLDALCMAAASAPSLERFLTELVLDPPSSTGELAGPPHLDDDWLTLSTIHSAKGGEWDAVHVIHLADGSLPSDMATGNDEEIEEERRLLYVAMTRARDRLWCYVPLRYHVGLGRAWWSDRHSYAQRSRFLTDAVVATMASEGDPIVIADRAPLDTAPLAEVDSLVASLLD